MPYVVTQSCCSDASCVVACPVNCIHPAPGEPGFAEAEMLYVDPQACVDCGACATACPVDALKPHTKLTDAELPFVELNRLYFTEQDHADRTPLAIVPKRRRAAREGVRVAVVGAGPAGLYAADELLKHAGVGVDVFDRLPTPYGLARAGVAPDHQDTKQVARLFAAIEGQPGFAYRLGVEVGRDLAHDELSSFYDAVVYAVGASADRRLGIPGEDLVGSISATTLVGWYNGHPDHQDACVDLGTERVVVVGNGNVALDVARILTVDPDSLARTDIADLPLAALRGSKVREVVVLGRRGPLDAAFTLPELVGLAGRTDLDIVVETGGLAIDTSTPKGRLIADLAARPLRGQRRVVLRFHTAPVRILGTDGVEGIEVARTEVLADGASGDGETRVVLTDDTEVIPTGMVLRSVGYRGTPVPGLPFDEQTASVPHDRGRVRAGVYVAGWIKRGPSGFIGTNKACSEETVAALLDDLEQGELPEPVHSGEDLELRLAETAVIGLEGWRAIDRAERAAGVASGRPRIKLVDVAHLRAAARPEARSRPAGRARGALAALGLRM